MSVQAPDPGAAVQRRLSDLLPVKGAGGPDVFLADREAALAALAGGTDPVLYRAWRGVLPPCESTPPEERDAWPGSLAWLADLVVYQDGTLPGGEPFRSTGHWNPDGQLEVFQVLSGRVLIVAAGTSATGRRYVQYQECRAGDVAIVPLAAWHLTYALDGPAIVFNIYTSQGSRGAQPAAGTSKYRCGRGPVPVAAVRKGNSFAFTWGTPSRPCCAGRPPPHAQDGPGASCRRARPWRTGAFARRPRNCASWPRPRGMPLAPAGRRETGASGSERY